MKTFKDPFHDLGRMVIDLAFQRFVIEQNPDKPKKPIKYMLAVLNSLYVYDGKKINLAIMIMVIISSVSLI